MLVVARGVQGVGGSIIGAVALSMGVIGCGNVCD
jgi:hypothetical protein